MMSNRTQSMREKGQVVVVWVNNNNVTMRSLKTKPFKTYIDDGHLRALLVNSTIE